MVLQHESDLFHPNSSVFLDGYGIQRLIGIA